MFDPVGLHDRLEVLLPARLLSEAKQVAEQAEAFFTRAGSAHYLADVRLARAELLHVLLPDFDAVGHPRADDLPRGGERDHDRAVGRRRGAGARSALRLGAREVALVCLESRQEMPAR